ncbi:putative SPFH domain-containing protein/band 7 family protein [Salmonella phage bastian]|uniref:Putative SPFH domain-containing protein/band 7 family protein n=1 Tax=Salmonella phage bastian TaxID=2713279 RepID=A0A6G8RHQ0_9CAUD|nr:lipoprotein [Salmonella phage bastian]QIO00860.1 putative SPFH domain-containing protein/band 7 family protein [Salmonella phage bastian]
MFTKNTKELTSDQKVIRTIKRWGIGAVVGLGALILALNSYTVVQDGTVKTQTFLGKVSPNPVLPGFHIVNPFASFDTFSTKDISMKLDKLQVPSQDKFKSTVDITVMLQFDGAKAPMNRVNAGTRIKL